MSKPKRRFYVTVTRACTESTTVDVLARTKAEAGRLALAEADAHPLDFDWVQDDCSGDQEEPYLPDPDGGIEEADD